LYSHGVIAVNVLSLASVVMKCYKLLIQEYYCMHLGFVLCTLYRFSLRLVWSMTHGTRRLWASSVTCSARRWWTSMVRCPRCATQICHFYYSMY